MKLFAVLLCVAGLAFASGSISGHAGGFGGGATVPQTDDVLDSYAYDSAQQMSNIGASFGDYATIDDFTYGLDVTVNINSYSCWAVTTGSAPTALELLVVEDASGVPTGAPVQQPSVAVTPGNTGYTYGGYTIWLAELDFSSSPVAVDTPVWLGSYRADGTNWYPVGGTTVTGSEGYRTQAAGWAWEPFSGSLESGDLFKVIDGEEVSLSRNTWAAIKANF